MHETSTLTLRRASARWGGVHPCRVHPKDHREETRNSPNHPLEDIPVGPQTDPLEILRRSVRPPNKVNLVLRFAAPYLAVAVFWFCFANAWLATLAYHALILLLAKWRIPRPRFPPEPRHLFYALPALAVGPLLYVLLPHLAGGPLDGWLAQRHFSASSLLLFLPYFGLIHPWLEQVHWKPLREHTRIAHPLFAGYHVLVLTSLTTWPWLVLVFCSLSSVSYLWERLTSHAKSLTPAYLSHALADIGIVVAACLRT